MISKSPEVAAKLNAIADELRDDMPSYNRFVLQEMEKAAEQSGESHGLTR
jgi:hypothetical protein